MPIDLSKKKWPDKNLSNAQKKESSALIHSASRTFVCEGNLYVRTVNTNGQVKEIDRENSKITALGYNGEAVYGATTGEKSILFLHSLESHCEVVAPLCAIENVSNTTAIIGYRDKLILAGNNDVEGSLIRITNLGLLGDVIQEWGMPYAKQEVICVPLKGEKILSLHKSKMNENMIYGITSKTGSLFSYDVNTNEVNIISEVSPIHFFSSVIVEDDCGYIYTFGALGEMYSYNQLSKEYKTTDIKIDAFPGRGPYAKISAAVYDPSENKIIVGDTEGLISKVDLSCINDSSLTNNLPIVVSLGKPIAIGGIDFLVRIADGRIYGVAGGFDGMSHLFVHEPKIGGLRDLGVCCATVEKGWYGYVFGAMVSLPNGRIILGENDFLGAVFSYYPSIF